MRFSWSLQTSSLLATSILVVVLCTAFGVAVHRFIELLEDEMLNRTLVRQMHQFVQMRAGAGFCCLYPTDMCSTCI